MAKKLQKREACEDQFNKVMSPGFLSISWYGTFSSKTPFLSTVFRRIRDGALRSFAVDPQRARRSGA